MFMYYFLQFIYSGLAGAFFALLFRAPMELFHYYLVIGGTGWVVSLIGADLGLNAFMSTLVGSIVLGTMSSVLARVKKQPSLIFYVPGFIPLVPGAGLYRSWMALIIEDTTSFSENILTTTLVALAIAVGIFLSTSVTQFLYRAYNSLKKSPKIG